MLSLLVLLGIVTVLLAPAAAYLTVVRRLSGKIGTTEASRLWDASEEMRKEYREEIERLQGVIDRMEKRIDDVESVNAELRTKNGDLHRMIELHEQTIADLRAQVQELRSRNRVVEEENVDLKRRIEEVENGT